MLCRNDNRYIYIFLEKIYNYFYILDFVLLNIILYVPFRTYTYLFKILLI